jgi:outer membrane scaffolding protein for murein synthesis (MipA/OmpV family)
VAVSQQAWPGAAEEVQRVLALPYVLYRGPLLRIDRGSAGLRALRRGNFELDIGVAGAFGSASKETQERQGMPRLGTLVEFGPRGIWQLGAAPGGGRWRAELPLRGVFDTDDRLAGRGWALEPELQYRHDGLAGWRLSASVGALLGDRRLNGTFYDVGSAYATAARPAYEARAGLIAWRLGLTASHRLSPEWRVFGFGRFDLVSGAANADSPLVSRQTGFTGGIGLQWTWMQSSQPAAD